jgi:hypothetical protein
MATATGFADRYTPGTPGDEAGTRATLRRLRWLANFLDTAIRLPGGFRFGADTIIGLTPIAGDVATALIACYFVYEGKRLGLPRSALLRMAGNVVIDFVLGATPILGDLADTIFKANVRNLAIIEAHVGRGAGRG